MDCDVLDQKHVPVMLGETLSGLNVQPEGCYLDATFGRGGHARAILERLNEQGRLLVMDRDPQAIDEAKKLAKDKRVQFYSGPFSQLLDFCQQENVVGEVRGILFDCGVSSPQLDDPERGFSFTADGPLDMRMDPSRGSSAADWLAVAKDTEIADVLYQFGEERYSRRLARAIVEARKQEPITRTKQLAEIIKAAHPAWEKHKHPATRSFQAIRIFINDELKELALSLEQAVQVLAPGGRLVAISFHSLEDRIVKQFIRKQEKGEEIPAEIPLLAKEFPSVLRRVGGAQKPSAQEVERNIRSRSAVLRVAEKQGEPQ